MGAKTWMIVYADGDARAALDRRPPLDRAATARLARTLFPGEKLAPLEDGDLSFTCPPDDELCIASFAGVAVVAACEFGLDHPTQLPRRFLAAGAAGTVTLHTMHSAVDFFGFAHWRGGVLVRALSVSPDSGVLDDVGARLPFELPYWAGERPAVEPGSGEEYPLPFHPLELGEAALAEFFGYQLEGEVGASALDPVEVPIARYRRARSRWRFWRR